LWQAKRQTQLLRKSVVGKRVHRKQSGHPSDADIAAFVSHEVSAAAHKFILAHLDSGCTKCRKLVAKVVSSMKKVRDSRRRSRS
jgi:hypothetical protein